MPLTEKPYCTRTVHMRIEAGDTIRWATDKGTAARTGHGFILAKTPDGTHVALREREATKEGP